MSRSHRKNFIRWCKGSNKSDKVKSNKKFRRFNRQNMHQFDSEDIINLLYKLREISNTCNFKTDGLAYYISKKDCIDIDGSDELWKKITRK